MTNHPVHRISSRFMWIASASLLTCGCIITISPPSSSGGDDVNDDFDSVATSVDVDSSDTTSDSGTTDDDVTATGTSTSTGTDDASTDTDCFFVGCPDMSIDGTCDSFLQDCPQGEKCVPIATDPDGTWDANVCVPVVGEQLAGDACVLESPQIGVDDCGSGLFCWDGECVAFCKGTADDPLCPPMHQCEIFNDGVINMCVSLCDPLTQNCSADEGCYWNGDTFMCATQTLDLATGEPCDFVNDCAPGNVCLVADVLPDCGGANCCASFCSLSDPLACQGQPGLSCASFFEMGQVPPGFEDVGACIAP